MQLISIFAPIVTAMVAIGAIIYTRRSATESIEKDIRIKLWDKRTELYQDLMKFVDESDVYRVASVETMAATPEGRTTRIVPFNIDSDEWKDVGSRVAVFASTNVAALFSYWKFTVAGWSWNRSALVLNFDRDEPEMEFDEGQARKDEEEAAESLLWLRDELLLHIRAELDFRQRAMPSIQFKKGVVDGFQAIRMQERDPFHPLELVANSHGMMATNAERVRGGWSITVAFDRDLFGHAK